MDRPLYPLLYQINTRVWLTELSESLKRRATLDDIPDAALDQLKSLGFDWIWMLSVWQTGKAAQQVSRTDPGWRKEFLETLPDLKEEDIAGSGFAITGYQVHKDLGGELALQRLRDRLRQRGMKLMLDFVPNHMAIDHPWTETHPEYFIRGTQSQLAESPQNYFRLPQKNGELILAHGRDPYFPGWPDTVQLNYGHPGAQEAMTRELVNISAQCDGVRCDMAMLVLPEIFERTWGVKMPQPFWSQVSGVVRRQQPDFTFMAEVYWDLEWRMLHEGFNYAYDKRLYDRLHQGNARPVREHFHADMDYQSGLARFLENHDEPRAAATFPQGKHEAAAILTFLSPGLRFFHQGQLEGRTKKISPHLVRAPKEITDERVQRFYRGLLEILRRTAFKTGQWSLLDCFPAWEGNATNEGYISFAWEGRAGERYLVVVNYSPDRAQCYIRLPFNDMRGGQWQLEDLMQHTIYERNGNDMTGKGLFMDEPGWRVYVFSIIRK